MAEVNETVFITLSAAADISAQQYNVVMITTNAGLTNVASNPFAWDAIGVLANQPSAASRSATIAVSGKYKVRAGAAVSSIGYPLTINGSGRAIAATSGSNIFARALETAAGDGNVISVLLQPLQRIGATP